MLRFGAVATLTYAFTVAPTLTILSDRRSLNGLEKCAGATRRFIDVLALLPVNSEKGHQWITR